VKCGLNNWNKELRITADKRLRYASPKFAIANFFYPQNIGWLIAIV
jgi:hypothetical protein